MALGADFHPEFQRVHVMALDAGVLAGDMIELGIVGHALILIATFDQGAVLRRRGRLVVDVGEAQVSAHRILVGQARILNARIDLYGRGAALVADHAASFRAFDGQGNAGGECHRLQRHGCLTVAGSAIYDLAHGDGRNFFACRRGLIAGRAVAGGAIGRNLLGIVLVPMAEGLGLSIGVCGFCPLFLKGAAHGFGTGFRLRTGGTLRALCRRAFRTGLGLRALWTLNLRTLRTFRALRARFGGRSTSYEDQANQQQPHDHN